MSLARKRDGILPGLRSWGCATPTCLWLPHMDVIPQIGTVGTAGSPAFGLIVSVGEPGSMHRTNVLVLLLQGLALGRIVGVTY